MALTLDSGPSTVDPIAISDCLRWVFQPDDADVVQTAGANAELVCTFANSPTAPSNGTAFTIWGFAMEVQSGTDYTANTFKVVAGDKLATMNNFAAMLQTNYYFLRDTTLAIGASTVTVTWNDCGEQPNFGAAQMDFDNLISGVMTTAVATNGTTAVYTGGYQASFRLYRVDIDGSESGFVTAFDGISPNLLCDSAESVVFDGMPTARELLNTPLPDLGIAHPTVDANTIIQYFSLLYGWTYQDENCQPQSGDFAYTNRSFVLNAYFEAKDVYKMRKYWPGAVGGLPGGQSYVKFLTTQPDIIRVPVDSRCWLWYMVNEAVQNWVELRMRIVVQKKDGSGVTTSVIITNSGYGVNAVNVSPAYIISLALSGVDATTLDFYQVHIVTQNSGNPLDLTQITETKTYYVDTVCDGITDLYFLTPMGGIGTIPVQIIESEAVQTGTEILLDVPCNASREDKARYGGRTLSNIRSYESLTLRATFNGQITDYFRDLKLSPQRWIRWTDETGAFIARKFIIETGGIRVFSELEHVTAEVSGFLGDIIIQSGAEPSI